MKFFSFSNGAYPSSGFLRAILSGLLTILVLFPSAQPVRNLVPPVVPGYSFIKKDQNRIQGTEELIPFFEMLAQQKENRNQRIPILHIGDSHLQADWTTTVIRQYLQSAFGNAGRGLVVPYHIAKTNEPADYLSYSDNDWKGRRCSVNGPGITTGMGCVSIQTDNPAANLAFRLKQPPGTDNRFNEGQLFAHQCDTCFTFRIFPSISAGQSDSGFSVLPDSAGRFRFPYYTQELYLEALSSDLDQGSGTIFGLSLEKDSAGILYHMTAANGAEYSHYLQSEFFVQQAGNLQPVLVILSLGTNEAQRRPFPAERIYKQVDSLITQLRLALPGTPILLTTPADSYRKKRYYNSGVSSMAALISQYAAEKHLACWDLFQIGGGYKSCYRWKKSGLLTRDGIHFSKKGYELQAVLFLEAIAIAYNDYLEHRYR
jgi:lysophospholipase L1-like esterase